MAEVISNFNLNFIHSITIKREKAMSGIKLIFILATAFFLQSFFPDTLFAISHEKILEQADRARGNTEGIEWKIQLDSIENDKKKYRIFNVKAKNFNCIAKFLAPSNVKGRKLLMIDRNMWFIKPGLRKPVPISPRQRLLGNASNGDIAATNYAGDYRIASVVKDSVNGEECYLYDLKGKTTNVTYDRIKYWISVNRRVGIKAEYYTISDKMFKSATIEYANKIRLGGITQPFISKMTIKDTIMNRNITTMQFSKIRMKKIPDSAFNINLLAR